MASGTDELWSTDGTAGGTTELKVISPIGERLWRLRIRSNLSSATGILYFAANDGTHGDELWQSDGTTGRDLPDRRHQSRGRPRRTRPRSPCSTVTWSCPANDGIHGTELMQTGVDVADVSPADRGRSDAECHRRRDFQLNLSLYASDPNNPPLPLTYSLGADAPAGHDDRPVPGLLSWPGASNQTAGDYSFTVAVSDSGSPGKARGGDAHRRRLPGPAADPRDHPHAGHRRRAYLRSWT